MDIETREVLRHLCAQNEALAAEIRALRVRQHASSDLTVAALALPYQESPEFLALRSRKDEIGRIRHVVRLLGDVPVAALTLVHLDDYRRRRAAEPGCRKIGGVRVLTAPATRNREVVRLVRMVNWAAERKMVDANPINGAPLEPEENTRRTSVERADVEAMREACLEYKRKTPRVGLVLRAMISTKYGSGMRRAELCRLRRTQLHFLDGMIELHELDTKGRKGRVTILRDNAAEDIRAIPRDMRFADSPFVFLTRRGKPYHPRVFLKMYQEVAALAGFKAADGERAVVHDLRGGFAGDCLDAGIPERDIMDMGGWTTREVFDRYHRRRGKAAVSRAKEKLERRGPQSTSGEVVTERRAKNTEHSQR